MRAFVKENDSYGEVLIWEGTLIGRKTLRLIMTVNNKTAQGIFFFQVHPWITKG